MSAATPGILTLYMMAPVLRSTHGRGTPATPLVRGNVAPGPMPDARRGRPRIAVRPPAGYETGRQRLYWLAERMVVEAWLDSPEWHMDIGYLHNCYLWKKIE